MKGISIEERATKLAHYIIEVWNKQKYSTQGLNTSERFENRTSYS